MSAPVSREQVLRWSAEAQGFLRELGEYWDACEGDVSKRDIEAEGRAQAVLRLADDWLAKNPAAKPDGDMSGPRHE